MNELEDLQRCRRCGLPKDGDHVPAPFLCAFEPRRDLVAEALRGHAMAARILARDRSALTVTSAPMRTPDGCPDDAGGGLRSRSRVREVIQRKRAAAQPIRAICSPCPHGVEPAQHRGCQVNICPYDADHHVHHGIGTRMFDPHPYTGGQS